MMNPLHIQPRNPSVQNDPSLKARDEGQGEESGFMGWIRRRFGAEHPHKQSPNFFISDITDGGIGSHHHHQPYRQDKQH